MSELTLFIDPYETDFPGPVCELLSQAPRQSLICATVTPDNYCVFMCGNVMYLFPNKVVDYSRTVKLYLPSTAGLQYSTNAVCVFRNNTSKSPHPSVIVVSPDGMIRYWADVSKPHHELTLNLNNEVAFSICLIETLDHVHRFLVSTTTASTFYLVDIFRGTSDHSGNLSYRSLEMTSAAGIGRRMSILLFGSFSGEKELVVKALFVRGRIRSTTVDVIAVLPRTLRFFSIQNQTLLRETNVAEIFMTDVRQKDADKQIAQSQVSVVDADVYQKGLLMLIAVVDEKGGAGDQRFINVDFYLGFMKEKHPDSDQYVSSFIPILLPDSMSQMEYSKLSKCKLLVANDEECAIVLPRSMIAVRHPNTDEVDAVVLNDINDHVLGAAAVEGLCHVVLRGHGVCVLRRLPRQFDLAFWRKYRARLEKMQDDAFSDNLLKKAFISFCSKNLKEGKNFVNKLTKKGDVNIAELSVELDKYFVDYRPTDACWTLDESVAGEDQITWLQEQANEEKNLQTILEQIEDKLSHHTMFVLFLEQYKLLDKVDRAVSKTDGRLGTVVLAEFGEKLVLVALSVSWMLKQIEQNNAVPALIVDSLKALGREFARRFHHHESSYLTACDHVFTEVTHFGEVISAVVTASEKALKRLATARAEERLRVILEVSAFLATVAGGVEKAKRDEQTLIVAEGTAGWLSQLLIHFIRHISLAFDFLVTTASERYRSDDWQTVLTNSVAIARFVLGQQNKWQRDKSQIIERFIELGETDIALTLAEEFHDFTTIIEYCHKRLDESQCQETLNRYKQMFAKDDFDLFLYEYYRKKGMVNYLLAEKSSRLNEFLASHETINWIRNIDDGEYAKACRTLKNMAIETNEYDKKLVELSLCKLCLLCQGDDCDLGELAEISDAIRLITEEREAAFANAPKKSVTVE